VAAKKPAKAVRGTEALSLVEAVIASGSDPAAGMGRASLCVQLPGGARVEVADARQAVLAAQLLRALATACPC
jgi:hypothetical protein